MVFLIYLLTSIEERFRYFNILRMYERKTYGEFFRLGVKEKNYSLQMLNFQTSVSF